MNQSTYNALKSFIWGIANDCLVDVYDRLFFRLNGELMFRRESLIGANAILLELWEDDAVSDDMLAV